MIKNMMEIWAFPWVCYGQYYKIELENKRVEPAMKEGTIKFYFWYVCNISLVVKPNQVV